MSMDMDSPKTAAPAAAGVNLASMAYRTILEMILDRRIPSGEVIVEDRKATITRASLLERLWTRATGDFDLRTFEVRAVPTARVEGLRPGMSAIAVWSDRARP